MPSLAPSKPFSLSLSSARSSGKPPLKPTLSGSTPAQGRKRPYSALADPDSEPEDDVNGRHEAVVGFSNDGKAISAVDTNKNQPLVIKSGKSGKDWREETRRRRRQKAPLPAEAQAQKDGQMGTTETVEVSTVGGLKISETKKDGDGDTTMENASALVAAQKGGETGEEKQLTADEEAVAALLGEKKTSTFTIPAVGDQAVETNGHADDEFANEADRFRADVDSCPPPATLADYGAIPVDGFGAALLRGMGWKDGEGVGKRGQAAATPREVKRRPALMGLGAKETPGGVSGEELGAWNHKQRRGKEKVAYNPLMLKNSVTGEMVTEEELELRKLEAKQGAKDKDEDWRDRRDRNLKFDNGERKERLAIEDASERTGSGSSRQERRQDKHRHRDDEKRRDDKHSSSRRERSRSRERDAKGSSRRERERSKDREHRKKDKDYDRRDRDGGSRRRDDDRDYERRVREKEYDRRDHDKKYRRH